MYIKEAEISMEDNGNASIISKNNESGIVSFKPVLLKTKTQK